MAFGIIICPHLNHNVLSMLYILVETAGYIHERIHASLFLYSDMSSIRVIGLPHILSPYQQWCVKGKITWWSPSLFRLVLNWVFPSQTGFHLKASEHSQLCYLTHRGEKGYSYHLQGYLCENGCSKLRKNLKTRLT